MVRQALAGASLEVTLRPRDARGEPIFPVAAHVTRGSVRGPLAARVVASGMSGEVTVRELAVRWDGRDEAGAVPPAGEYVLVLELAAAIDGVERRETIGVVFSLAEP